MFHMTPSRRNRPQAGQVATHRATPFDQLRSEFESVFDRFFGNWPLPFESDFGEMRWWDFDTKETDKEIVVRAEMPGFDANDLDVQLRDNVLTIQAEKRQEGGQEESFNSFRRTVTLPSGVNAEKAQATYRNGVLELHIPKTEESHGKRIAVQGQTAGQAQMTDQTKAAAARAERNPAEKKK